MSQNSILAQYNANLATANISANVVTVANTVTINSTGVYANNSKLATTLDIITYNLAF